MTAPVSSTAAHGFALARHAAANDRPATLAAMAGGTGDKARATAQEFEATFLTSMFNQMLETVKGDGPFGGAGDAGVWRSFLSDEYARSFARAGGVGIGDAVYRTLLAQQEASR